MNSQSPTEELTSWERAQLRVHQERLDRLFDPETGIYAKLADLELQIKGAILKIVASVVLAVVTTIAANHVHL